MAATWNGRRWLRIAVVMSAIVAAGSAGLYYIYTRYVGLPKTPMTVTRANDLFQAGVRPGQTRAEVEACLASQGIQPEQGASAAQVCFCVLHRRDDTALLGDWIGSRGNQTVAELAGLDINDVYSVVRVTYPDADRSLLSRTEVRTYLFFDEHERLIRQWVDEFQITL